MKINANHAEVYPLPEESNMRQIVAEMQAYTDAVGTRLDYSSDILGLCTREPISGCLGFVGFKKKKATTLRCQKEMIAALSRKTNRECVRESNPGCLTRDSI
jgi:hypothetical protein